ncbi:MAG: type II toxin-antitoxin system Phd/YefM family antitoxin [Vulcanimicrobiota bacterium]
MRQWQLQEAKARLSELVGTALREGPQEISLRGKPAVVVLSISDYENLVRVRPPFVDFIRNSPLAGIEISIERDKSFVREIKL